MSYDHFLLKNTYQFVFIFALKQEILFIRQMFITKFETNDGQPKHKNATFHIMVMQFPKKFKFILMVIYVVFTIISLKFCRLLPILFVFLNSYWAEYLIQDITKSIPKLVLLHVMFIILFMLLHCKHVFYSAADVTYSIILFLFRFKQIVCYTTNVLFATLKYVLLIRVFEVLYKIKVNAIFYCYHKQ